jgi:hypothetical protein
MKEYMQKRRAEEKRKKQGGGHDEDREKSRIPEILAARTISTFELLSLGFDFDPRMSTDLKKSDSFC